MAILPDPRRPGPRVRVPGQMKVPLHPTRTIVRRMSEPQPGEILAGKYRVEKVLGQGGMGVVIQATHVQLDERVAMKFLLPEYAEHPEASARFLREARAAVKIKSEHVARVVDVGTLENGAPYMVMEYLHGKDLSQVLEGGLLSVEDAIEFVLQATEALAEAHAAGIVHRDLKPANLFLTRRADGSELVKVLDFGISKVATTTDSTPEMSLTKTSTMMGSPLYMSPEQMRSSRDVDARSDLWSLGAILFELLTGRTPFLGTSIPELCANILTNEAPPVSSLRPEVPPGLDAVIARCLAKTPEARYASVAEVAVALAPFGPLRARLSAERVCRVLGDTSSSATHAASDPALARTAATGSGTQASWAETGARKSPRNNRTLIVAATASTLVVLAAAATLGLSGEATPELEGAAHGGEAVASATETDLPEPMVPEPTAAPVIDPPEESAGTDPAPIDSAEPPETPTAPATNDPPQPKASAQVHAHPAPSPKKKTTAPSTAPAPKSDPKVTAPAPTPAPKTTAPKSSPAPDPRSLFGDRK
jgi:eukaryotic-like serine/threonine-protein kinase